MILVTGVEELDDRLDTVFGYKRTDLKKRSETWISAARTALDLAGWQSEAKFRSLQTIHLIIYTSLVSFWRSNRKVTNGIWLSAALQIAQTLGLHQLGSEDTTMPPDDPGLPHGACALKRQMALRIWHHLVRAACSAMRGERSRLCRTDVFRPDDEFQSASSLHRPHGGHKLRHPRQHCTFMPSAGGR